MLQKSQLNGTAARELDAHGVIVPQVGQLPAGHGCLADIGELAGCVDALRVSGGQVGQEGRQRDLGLIEHEVVDLGELLVLAGKQRSTGHHRQAGLLAALDRTAGLNPAGRSWR